jgi:hypothetical protein
MTLLRVLTTWNARSVESAKCGETELAMKLRPEGQKADEKASAQKDSAMRQKLTPLTPYPIGSGEWLSYSVVTRFIWVFNFPPRRSNSHINQQQRRTDSKAFRLKYREFDLIFLIAMVVRCRSHLWINQEEWLLVRHGGSVFHSAVKISPAQRTCIKVR